MLDLPAGAEGVLASQHLRQAIDTGVIDAGAFKIPTENIQPASLDLRLGEVGYRLRCSFLPDRQTVERKVKDYIIDELDLHKEGIVLEPERPYLVQLKERLALPEGIRAKANPKSSTGRLDVFTRVITDHSYRFDEIRPGYEGQLWLEIVPLSFAIRIREDLSLNQIRLSIGRSELDDDEVRRRHAEEPLLYHDGKPVAPENLALSNGMFLSLDLRGDEDGRVGHRARDSAPLLDLTRGERVNPGPYWESVHREDGQRVVLTPKKFYLLMSDEAVSIPPWLSSEMTVYDPTSGELRTHYAGFFDPGFGYDPAGQFQGSRAALEVRAHDVPFMVEHGQRVCKLTFERMLEVPETLYGGGIGSSYQQQTETLSKHFNRVSFASDTAVRAEGEGGGSWSATIAEGWDIAGNANGGYLLAIAARAILQATGRPDPITVTAHYLSPGKPGTISIPVRPVREGRRFSTAGATLLAEGKPVIEVLMTAGDLSQNEGPDFELLDGGPPELPPPAECARRGPTAMAAGFAGRIDMRSHPDDMSFLGDAGKRNGRALIRGWFRLTDDEPLDTVGLLLAADAFPPTVFNLDIPVNWVPTVELTVHVRARPAPGWLRCRFSTRYISDGFMEEDGEVWDSAGRLVALSRQLALMPKGLSHTTQ